MDSKDLKSIRKGIKTGAIAGRDTDPLFYRTLSVLPNPDPILRRLGRTDNIYDAIASDAHVRGELRAIRAGLFNFKMIVTPGGSETREKAAADLCQEWLNFKPSKDMTWPDVVWNMGCAVFKGYRVHELVWDKWDNFVLPVQVLDVPNRRIIFNTDNQMRLLTKEQPVDGIEVPDYKFLLSRHMPTAENPYGEALFSSCFWPYTFKHGGWKFFYKFCERFGLPWPVGKYPAGTPEKEQDALAAALEVMVESGYAVIPDGDIVQLLEVTTSGDLAQERMIALCNKEMSMVLTSQSIITNQQGVGSFASTQTSRAREKSVNDADISIIEATFNMAFEYITKFNFGEDVMPPTLKLHKDDEVDPQLVEAYVKAASVSPEVDLADFHARTGIKRADAGQPTLTPARNPAPVPGSTFASSTAGTTTTTSDLDDATTSANQAIESDWIEPAFAMLQEYESKGKTLKQYLDDLPKLYGKLDDTQVQDITSQVMKVAMAKGMKSTDG